MRGSRYPEIRQCLVHEVHSTGSQLIKYTRKQDHAKNDCSVVHLRSSSLSSRINLLKQFILNYKVWQKKRQWRTSSTIVKASLHLMRKYLSTSIKRRRTQKPLQNYDQRHGEGLRQRCRQGSLDCSYKTLARLTSITNESLLL